MRQVKAASIASSIIGTYEGEALDPQITNKNGLDITREVMTKVLESEDYADGIKNGWFIGYLGHPEDPDCQDFKNGCIVMTDMSIESDNKVHAKFNLVNTPVGQVVKAFIDAGVKFGISIRGAGDIIGNSVDPDTFVFRGYDLVAFPAYPESIPEFKEIAASTNSVTRKKYQKVCASVKSNLKNITSTEALDFIQKQFAPQSDVFASIEARKSELKNELTLNIDNEKITAMTDLYIEAMQKVKTLASEVEDLKRQNAVTASKYEKRLASIKRISGKQLGDTIKSLDSVTASRDALKRRTTSMRDDYSELKRINASLTEENHTLTEQLRASKKSNLIYKQKIESSTDEIEDKNEIIASLKQELRETVTASTRAEDKTSNLGEQVKSLKSEIKASRSELRDSQSELDEQRRINDELQAEIQACKDNLSNFQTAYAKLYAGMLGVSSESIVFNSGTTISEIQKSISGSTNTANIAAAPADVDESEYYEDELGLITM